MEKKMKKLLVILILLAALIFVVSCGGSSKNCKSSDTLDNTAAAETQQTEDDEPENTEPSDKSDSDDTDETQENHNSDIYDEETNKEQNDDAVDTADSISDEDAYADYGDTIECGSLFTTDYIPDTNAETDYGNAILECSPFSGTPCQDSISGLIWSARSSNYMEWNEAVEYCEKYSEGGISGWHLPNINELRTLIRNCSVLQTGGSCAVADPDCLFSYCGNHCSCYYKPCSSYYSKLGDHDGIMLWSSSTNSGDPDYAWRVGFSSGEIDIDFKNDLDDVRCVRNAD